MLRLSTCFLTLSLLAAPALADEGAAPATFAEVRSALLAEQGALVVAGDGERKGKGPGDQRTRFTVILEALRTAAQPDELLGLAKHDSAMVRVTALAALAEAHPKRAFKALEARRYSREPVAYLPRGERKATKISEGRLVSKLLFNSNLLRWGERSRPLVKVPLPASEPKAKRFDWARCALLADADALSVGGRITGRGAAPCRFYVLVEEIQATAEDEEILDLVAAEPAVVRVAGMAALVRRDGARAAKVLPKHFEDSRQLTLVQGCIAQHVTVGELAKRLLKEPSFLQ